jgi:TolA-binding protein
VRDPRFFKRPHRPVSVIMFELNARMRSLAAPELPGGVDPNVLLEIAGLHAELARVTPTSTREHDEARAEARAEYVRYGGLVPGTDGADSAAYFVALEYELDGDRVVARAAYQALLTQTPTAWTAPYCHVGLAELLLRDYPTARSQALTHYEAALGQLRRAQDLYPFVLLRIFQSQRALGETKAATRTRERLEKEFPHSEATTMATED